MKEDSIRRLDAKGDALGVDGDLCKESLDMRLAGMGETGEDGRLYRESLRAVKAEPSSVDTSGGFRLTGESGMDLKECWVSVVARGSLDERLGESGTLDSVRLAEKSGEPGTPGYPAESCD